MIRGNSSKKILMECPICDEFHEVEERTRIVETIIKGELISYEETYLLCCNSDEDENEFVTGKMENENLLNARNAYRKVHNLLTSDEIVDIRGMYGLSQVDLAKLLGWGEATISRYESKAIQDESYDITLRTIRDNPLATFEYFNKNKASFSFKKAETIEKCIKSRFDSEGKEYLQRQLLRSEYANYYNPCDENGFTVLDIDKIEAIISYFATKTKNLHKVRLMKMLWYADSLYFNLKNRTMTGLVYVHERFGALPIGHYTLVGLKNINMIEEYDGDNIVFHFYPNATIDYRCISKDELKILDIVIEKFVSWSTTDIVSYMHNEQAYLSTADDEIIPFSLTKTNRAFD